MLKIKIGQREFEYLDALETEEFYNGSSRRTLTVTCDPNAIGLDELNNLLTEENLASITMTNTEMLVGEEGAEEPLTNIYEGYVLKLSCGITNALITPETSETRSVYADRLIFKVGKRTYIEQMLHNMGL